MPLKSIKVDEVTYTCKHAAVWPPAATRIGGDPEILREIGKLDEARYEQWKTWARVCGLQAMSAEKCPTCPYVVRKEVPERPQPARPRPKTRRDGR